MVQPISGESFNNPLELGNRFIDMSRLQLLRAEGDCLERIFSPGHSPRLVWLSWHQCPYSFLPSWMPMKNLRVLEVTGGELETLWQNRSEAPLQLRELNIRAGLLQFPKFIGQLKHLEKIALVDTMRDYIETLPEELFHLSSLKHLRLCMNMKSLPNSFGNLTNLQHIDLSGCSKLQTLPHSFRNLVRLKHLCLAACFELSMSSEVLGNISTLESLDLSNCMKMEVLPPQITHQRSLEEMCLLNTNLKELPSAIGGLISLENLKLGSPLLETLPPLLGDLTSLKELTLSGCGILKCMPNSIGELKQLRRLEIEYSGIEYLPIGLTELNNLEILKVHTCPLREVPFASVEMVERGKTALTDLRGHIVFDSCIDKCMLALKYLELHWTIISEVSFPKGVCPNLQHLKIKSCNDLVEVGELPSTLVTLEFSSCCALKKIEGLWGLANLRQLDISGCKEVEELPSLETLESLEEFRASECVKLKSIRGLAQLTKLRMLDLKESNDIEERPGVEKLRSLQKLNASGCPKLQQDGGLMQLRRQILTPDEHDISISVEEYLCSDSGLLHTENNTNNSRTHMESKTDKKHPIIQKIATTHLWLRTKIKRIQMCKGICGYPCNQRRISNN
jgi:Leucine-rich repeat (LRR) protein